MNDSHTYPPVTHWGKGREGKGRDRTGGASMHPVSLMHAARLVPTVPPAAMHGSLRSLGASR